MANFTICTFKGKPAVLFHHDYGDFEFVIVQDPENPSKVAFDSNVQLTPRLYNLIGKQAIRSIQRFGTRFGYTEEHELTFDDITKILRTARSYHQQYASHP